MRKYDEAIQGVVTTNIYNTKIKITSPKNIQGIRISAEVTDNAIINIENSMIETISNQSSVTLIYSQLCPSSTQINITKSDLIGVSNSDTNISYGIFGNNNTRASINRSTILVNKHLEKTDIKNSIGIYGTNDTANTYSTIFGTKANIE